ncbi:MAG: hypothetical protein K6E84_07400 [Lachnospiraceae bacterium]|nr:hypothetical protein [Lachnospiraceae bacterium]
MSTKRVKLMPCVLMALYSYVYSSFATYSNILASDLLDPDGQVLLYRLSLLPFALGILFFGLWQSVKPMPARKQRLFTGVVSLCALPAVSVMFLTGRLAFFYGSVFTLSVLTGLICSFVHLTFLDLYNNLSKTGLYYGISISIPILIQYIVQNLIGDHRFGAYSILLVLFIMAMLLLHVDFKIPELQDESLKNSGNKHTFFMLFTAAVITTMILELLGNFMTSSLLTLYEDGTILAYSFPRLFIILAYLVAGIVSDRKNMRYLPAYTLCVIFISILNPILFHRSSDQAFNTCLYYIMAGTVNYYFTMTFINLARNRRFAPLICTSGRLIDSIFSCLFVTPILYTSRLETVIFIELVAIVIMILVLSFTGQLNFSVADRLQERISPREFAARYSLTEKETEVFVSAIDHTGTTSDLAKSLFLSRSILYRYLHNICEKTGCENFSSVKKMYYELSTGQMLPQMQEELMSETPVSPTDPMPTSPEYENAPENNTADTPQDKLASFAEKYDLSGSETETLALFLEHPGMTQTQLADLAGCTLRTMQRRLATLRRKTEASSLSELTARYLSDTL